MLANGLYANQIGKFGFMVVSSLLVFLSLKVSIFDINGMVFLMKKCQSITVFKVQFDTVSAWIVDKHLVKILK
jgi:hypothetical protein